ncbi:hypothetical protein EI94DRAFT_1618955 [Lactarius quietus]|nr:hypothetical protein EI94DRAFT_1618955 [Lactarius quietus]
MSAPDGDGVHGTVCTEDQYQSSTNVYPNETNPSITCLTHGQGIGLTVVAEASLLSIVAVIFIFILIGRNVLRYRRALPRGRWTLLQGPADIYMLSLFVYDVLQALGGVLNIRWAHNGIVTTGSYCTAQGIIQQIGELGVALITLILTIHTFVVALWNVGSRARHLAFGIVSLATLFITFWVGFGNGTHKNFETPTPYWCWVGPSSKFKLERLAGEYVWMWIALFASVILYVPLYFWTMGRLSVNLQSMLLYPLAYSLMVLPVSIARWSLFDHKNVTSAATFFSVSVFNLSGAINVLLFLTVRPQLLLFSPPDEFCEPEGTEHRRPATGSAVFTDAPNYNHSPQPAGIELAEV